MGDIKHDLLIELNNAREAVATLNTMLNPKSNEYKILTVADKSIIRAQFLAIKLKDQM